VISIEINGQKLDIKDNLLLKDAIETAKAFYIPETTIGILKTAGKKEEATSEYKILTTKGELKIELFGDSTLWTKFSHFFTDINAHWESRYAIAYGPFETGITVERAEQKYNRYDVFIGTGGYDPKNSYLMIAKDKHISDYGGPIGTVLGKVITGKNVIANLKQGD